MYVEKTKTGFKFVERYTDPLSGKTKRVSVVLPKNTAQARRDAQKTLAAKIEEKCSIVLKPKETTVGDLVDAYKLRSSEITVSTQRRNEYAMIYWEKLLGRDTLLSVLPRLNILGMMEEHGEEPATMNERLKRFKTMVRWGYAAGIVESTEFLGRLRPFKVPPHKEKISNKFLERDDYKRLISMMSVEKWKLLTELMVLSGMRFGEAAALEVGDVDFDAKEIHITKTWDSVNKMENHPKSYDSCRNIHMQPQLLEVCREIHSFMLKRRLLSKGKPLFMVDDDGTHLHYDAFRMHLKEKTAKYCGHEVTPHALRATSASIMFAQGFTELEVARRLGHASSKITHDVYIHITKELREKDARRFDTFAV